ncbi:MAG: alkaline phosphatase D family protein [Bacteroidota bacterium]
MRIHYTLILCFFAQQLWAQLPSPTAGVPQSSVTRLARTAESQDLPFDETLRPFYHGVASGDPTENAVIIWTRVTPENDDSEINVSWVVATDINFDDVVAEGLFTTTADRDWTVKVDVTELAEGTTYYYTFSALGKQSMIGKTRTAGNNAENKLKFAVVSCQNYEAGYFVAFDKIADRTDLDAVIHLGDYIYEYGLGVYGNDLNDRSNIPETETLTLADYRTRYSLYRLDPSLRRAHQQHAFIPVWDDHESANDAYKDGAENHDPTTEGSWTDRLAIAKQVYTEWMPIRTDVTQESLYRTVSYGDLAEIIMLDTRIEGREEQINDVTNPALYSPTRTLLGETQRDWLTDNLANSTAKWKILGNQIIFSEFNVGVFGPVLGQTPAETESTFLDIWDGYPLERDLLIDYISDNNINNVVWLTGDFHCSFAYDVAKRPTAFGWDGATPSYDPTTGAGSVAIEFATPSVSSANFDENFDTPAFQPLFESLGISADFFAAYLEDQINEPLVNQPSLGLDWGEFAGLNPNPHMKYVDLDDHGYFVMDIQNDKIQADWYHIEDILTPDSDEELKASWFSNDGENHLTEATAVATPKANQDTPAPEGVTTGTEETLVLWGLYPNPTTGKCYVNYGLNSSQHISLNVWNVQGQQVMKLLNESQDKGNYTYRFDLSDLAAGIYFVKFVSESGEQVRKIVVEK